MTEEEKEAIEELEMLSCYGLSLKLTNKNIKSIDIILNLIEKQQHEIEGNEALIDVLKHNDKVWNELYHKQEKELKKIEALNIPVDTLIAEFKRLENIEDEKIQVEVKFIEEKRDKYWEKKIKDRIEELEDYMIFFTNDKEKFNRYKYARNTLEKLLRRKNNV